MQNSVDFFTDGRRTNFAYKSDNENLIEFIGKANPGTLESAAGWQIRKLEYSGLRVVGTTFADASDDFDKIWDDRETFDYDPDS